MHECVSPPLPLSPSHYVLTHLKTDTQPLISLCLNVCVIISVIIRVAFKWLLKSLESERSVDLPMNPIHTDTHRQVHLNYTRSHIALTSVPITHIPVYTHVHTIALINRHFSASVGLTAPATAVYTCV